MEYTFYEMVWLFIIYSLAGWIVETIYAAFKQKKFVNRGILSGPLCIIYGFSAVIMTLNLWELQYQYIFLFLGCMIYSTLIEWIAGHLLEWANHGKWWDYSNVRWNLDGYICLPYSILWGILGVIVLKWLNPFLSMLLHYIPNHIETLVIWIIIALLILDGVGSFLTVSPLKNKFTTIHRANNKIAEGTLRFGLFITSLVEKRINQAHPTFRVEQIKKEKSTVFAEGCSFYKIIWLFILGAFLGDIVETIFCRFSMGRWMSRSSVVWGPFSIVWGLAIAGVTMLLYKYKDRSDSFLFFLGTFLGGAYEYFCSVFTEIFFGTVFWDYSKIPFNLGGRINLLFCFFWGIAAVIWLKCLYPRISDCIEKVPVKTGKIISWMVILFMIVNIMVSVMALSRYDARNNGIEPRNAVEQMIDMRFPDERMKQIYPNAKMVKD